MEGEGRQERRGGGGGEVRGILESLSLSCNCEDQLTVEVLPRRLQLKGRLQTAFYFRLANHE